MTNKAYSGAFSRRRYSNLSATTTAAGGSGLSVDPNPGGSARRYSFSATSANPSMGIVQATIISEVAQVNAGGQGADFAALGSGNTYPEGTVFEVWAKPKPGYRFIGWDQQASGRQTNPMRVTLTKNVALTAYFSITQQQTRTINVNWNETMGRVQASGLQNGQISGIAQGATVTLNANPNSGYHFVKWVGGPSNSSASTPHYTFQANANYDITAVFAKNADSPVDIDPSGNGTVEPSTPGQGGGGGGNNGGTIDPNPGTGTLSGGGLIDKVKPFVKKWWWAIAIVAYIVFKDQKGGAE